MSTEDQVIDEIKGAISDDPLEILKNKLATSRTFNKFYLHLYLMKNKAEETGETEVWQHKIISDVMYTSEQYTNSLLNNLKKIGALKTSKQGTKARLSFVDGFWSEELIQHALKFAKGESEDGRDGSD